MIRTYHPQLSVVNIQMFTIQPPGYPLFSSFFLENYVRHQCVQRYLCVSSV